MSMDDDHTEEEPVDPFPAMMAELDQFMKNIVFMAQMVKGSYDAYREQGFTDKQALYLAGLNVRPSDAPGE